jgi:hypothetical protein
VTLDVEGVVGGGVGRTEIVGLIPHSRTPASCAPVVGSVDASSPLGYCAIARVHGDETAQAHGGRAVGSKIVGHKLVRNKGHFLEQFSQQFQSAIFDEYQTSIDNGEQNSVRLTNKDSLAKSSKQSGVRDTMSQYSQRALPLWSFPPDAEFAALKPPI